MLDNFFRINLPYGIAKDADGKWMAFNREYLPLGFNDQSIKRLPGEDYHEYPIYTRFNIPNRILEDLANDCIPDRDENGEIIRIWFYNDGTNPTNITKGTKEAWDLYFSKIKKLSSLEVIDWRRIR